MQATYVLAALLVVGALYHRMQTVASVKEALVQKMIEEHEALQSLPF